MGMSYIHQMPNPKLQNHVFEIRNVDPNDVFGTVQIFWPTYQAF